MVFDSWIVVASIKLAYVMDLVSSGSGFGCVVVCCGVIFLCLMVLCFVSV